jgi:glycosyltransferase involved in cell wall biosynthesis
VTNSPSVLMVTTVGRTLGFLVPFAHQMRALGWRVGAAAHKLDECPCSRDAFDELWEVEWSRNPWDLANVLGAPRRIAHIVENGRYDLVHVHTPIAGFVTRFALRGMRRQHKVGVVYTAHGFHFYRGGRLLNNALYLGLEKLAAGWTDRLVVINWEDQEAALRCRLVPPDKLVHMPGIGVDALKYSARTVPPQAVESIRRELGLAPQDHVFLAVGHLYDVKRPWDAVSAVAQLARDDVHLAFAGSGAMEGHLRQQARDLGIEAGVHFLGTRSDIPALLQTASALLLLSSREGLPRSAMEAMAASKPVIGTRIRGTEELLRGSAGILVPVGDVTAIASAMEWVVNHPEDARAMGERARRRVREYGQDRVAAAHERLYSELLAEMRPARKES